MYVRCCLVEIARKSVTETANLGRKLSGVVLLFCGVAKVFATANYCSWLIPARQWRLDGNNTFITL